MLHESVLFVCTGNICRSPTAEAIFRKIVNDNGQSDKFVIDSASTHSYHTGNPPDSRAQLAGSRRGYHLEGLRARQIEQEDFHAYKTILAMDAHNLAILRQMCPQQWDGNLSLMLDYHPNLPANSEVPDPYYGGDNGFDRVIDLLHEACKGLFNELRSV